MALVLRPGTNADHALWRSLVGAPGIAHQYDPFQGEAGFLSLANDPHFDRDSLRFAFLDGAPAGFAFAWLLGHGPGAWAMVRVAVTTPHQRHGAGRALAEAVIHHVESVRGFHEVATAAWLPEPGAHALTAKLGFHEDRTFWMMTRTRRAVLPEPEWPAGIVVRPFDGSDRELEGWTFAYNDSFSQHYRFVPSSVEEAREIAANAGFRADGMLLAWRGERCVGFARNAIFQDRGEVAVLGTAHEARGIGLGRALLRAGVAWLEANTPNAVTLVVDGDNENALKLYLEEGFEISRTRRIWVRRTERR